MRKLTLLLGTVVVLAAMALAGSALAGKPVSPDPCLGGTLTSNTYGSLTFSHDCKIDSAVTINGNVTVGDGVFLDASYLGTVLTINGNVKVGKGATLGLGCAFYYHPTSCGFDPSKWIGNVTVNGNIDANNALTMYLDFTTVHGNVIVNGGGDITLVDHFPAEDGLVLPIKDNKIDGNVIVHGWQGAWFGVIRNTVGGNVMVSNNVGTRFPGDPDSTEIVDNTITGNLICQHNTPAAQAGDSGGGPNAAHNKIGECAGL